MKKIFRLSALLLALALLLCACGGENNTDLYEINGENAWFSYPVDSAPVKAVNAGEVWYLLKGDYHGDCFTLAVGADYAGAKNVYSASGVSIWFFEANAFLAAWCEKTAETLRFMVYDTESGEAKEIFTESAAEGFAPANVGVWGKNVYFANIDYRSESAAIMRYNAETGELSRYIELEYRGEHSCTSLSADGGVLLASVGTASSAMLVKAELSSGAKEYIPLEKDVSVAYACAYDRMNGGYAVYYRDVDGAEHIGTVNPKNGKIKNVFTFGENVYAYQDALELCGGHLYWISQINASGKVSEHYSFIDYDLVQGTADEYLKTFAFALAEDGVTLLSFNAADYDAIYLTEIYLGGQ